jgi:hypothetical protein
MDTYRHEGHLGAQTIQTILNESRVHLIAGAGWVGRIGNTIGHYLSDGEDSGDSPNIFH